MAETTTYITVQQKYRSLLKSCKNLISTEDIRLVRKAFDTAMSSEANSRAVTEKDIHRLLDISRFTGYKPYLRYSPGGGFRKFPEITTEFC